MIPTRARLPAPHPAAVVASDLWSRVCELERQLVAARLALDTAARMAADGWRQAQRLAVEPEHPAMQTLASVREVAECGRQDAA